MGPQYPKNSHSDEHTWDEHLCIFKTSSIIERIVKRVLIYSNLKMSEDWLNFLERMKKRDLSEAQLWENDDAIELRLWASYRGQTLARTVRGMMYYERCVMMDIKVTSG